jgi:Uncharacterized conserved protein
MNTVKSTCEYIYTDKKSEFIGMVFPVQTKEECDILVRDLRKQHPNARHVCFAYRVGADTVTERMSDDGEPGGTAGAPILSILRGRELVGVLAVVVRHFGGILLGTGGLTRAYSSAISGALESTEFFEIINFEAWEAEYGYPLHDRVMFVLHKFSAVEVKTDFGEKVTISAKVPSVEYAGFVKDINEILRIS